MKAAKTSSAQELDQTDELAPFRSKFLIPKGHDGREWVYLAGNSLGLQPARAREYVDQELEDWARLGVEGHLQARHPWLPYHELLTERTARLVGARPSEVVVMNTLSVNLHLMMVSFYRPLPERHRILAEASAFPSDQYAVASQARFHGYDPKTAIQELMPRPGEATLRTEDILATLERDGKSIALVLLGGVNYLSGQAFDLEAITRAGHAQGCRVGFDLAHGAGNLEYRLHDWNVDFAVWCSYKYLNAGPGGLSGCFIHERHGNDALLPRFEGWWGHDKTSRFQMGPEFKAIPGAEGWQLSNPPILQLAALRASMEIFDEAGMSRIRKKSLALTGYLESRLREKRLAGACEIVTPSDPAQRGAQLSLRFRGDSKALLQRLAAAGVICDFREPNIVRAAPTALYNRFSDVDRFVEALDAEGDSL